MKSGSIAKHSGSPAKDSGPPANAHTHNPATPAGPAPREPAPVQHHAVGLPDAAADGEKAKAAPSARDYAALLAQVSATGTREERLRAVTDLLWERLHPTGVSWVGFYLHEGGDELVLHCCRNKPACSPIGLHGVCGQSFREQRTVIVRDVRALGENYVACDPRDLSEIVVPLIDKTGRCWGVLDADSHEVGAFDAADAAGFLAVLERAGLTVPLETSKP